MDFVGPLGCPSELLGMTEEELKKEKLLFVCGGALIFHQLINLVTGIPLKSIRTVVRCYVKICCNLAHRFLHNHMDIEAPRVAKTCQPGQFVIVKMDEKGERIPLTVCDYDREKGIVTIVF